MNKKNISGKIYGEWIVMSSFRIKKHGTQWLCKCSCGEKRWVWARHLSSGASKSCGCLKAKQTSKRFLKHGGYTKMVGKSMKTSPELAFCRRFTAMRARCENVNDSTYKYYGGRGIKNKWKSFIDFKNDMLESFLKHVAINDLSNTTLDRCDGDGDYSLKNCRWATRKKQSLNTHNVHLLTYNGKTDSINGWSIRLKIPGETIRRRIMNYGWSTKKALTTPAQGTRGGWSV